MLLSLISNTCRVIRLNKLGDIKGNNPSRISTRLMAINNSLKPIKISSYYSSGYWLFTSGYWLFKYLKKSPLPSNTNISFPVPIEFLYA